MWLYNTRAYSRLVDVLEAVTGDGIGRLTGRWLTEPLGMDDTEWRPRPWVTPGMDANPLGLFTTARDLVRFGELMLAGGAWQGRRLVSEGFVEAAVKPSQSLNPAYGLLWWLNGRPSSTGPEAAGNAVLAPAAPEDMYAAQGALGRKLYVVPSLDLVVVRLGDAPADDFNQRFWELLMAAAPAAPSTGCSTLIADLSSQAQAPDGRYLTWVEHIIDDPSRGIPDLAGGDGLAMADLDGDGFDDIVSVYEADTVYDGQPHGRVRIAWGSKDPGTGPEHAGLRRGGGSRRGRHAGGLRRRRRRRRARGVRARPPDLLREPGRGARTADWRRVIIPITTHRGSYIRAFAADLDGDGRPEVAAANKGEQNPDANTTRLSNVSLYLVPRDPLQAGMCASSWGRS